MKLFSWFKNSNDSESKAYQIFLDIVRNGKIPNYDYAGLEEVYNWGGMITACIDARSLQIAKAKPIIYKRLNQSDVEEIDNHEFMDLLYIPNNEYGSVDILELTQKGKDIHGECYWYIPFGKYNKPASINIIPAPQLKPIVDNYGHIDHYEQYIGGKEPLIIPKEEIIPFREFNITNFMFGYADEKNNNNANYNYYDYTKNTFYKSSVSRPIGFSLIQKAAKPCELDIQLTKYFLSILKNGAILPSVIQAEGELDDEQIDKFQHRIDSKYSGVGKFGKTLVLNGGFKYTPTGLNPQQLMLIEAKEMVESQIRSICMSPAPLFGKGTDTNKSTSQTTATHFNADLINPLLKKIASPINIFIQRTYNDKNLFLGFIQPLPEDPTLDRENYVALSDIANVAKDNPYAKQVYDDFRLYMNLDPYTIETGNGNNINITEPVKQSYRTQSLNNNLNNNSYQRRLIRTDV